MPEFILARQKRQAGSHACHPSLGAHLLVSALFSNFVEPLEGLAELKHLLGNGHTARQRVMSGMYNRSQGQ